MDAALPMLSDVDVVVEVHETERTTSILCSNEKDTQLLLDISTIVKVPETYKHGPLTLLSFSLVIEQPNVEFERLL